MKLGVVMPVFQQFLDVARPHTLLTENPREAMRILYRYEDTGETVLVPNVWHNQTYQMRIAQIRFDASLNDDLADRIESDPPTGLSPSAVKDIARRYRERAAQMRAAANELEEKAGATRPVIGDAPEKKEKNGPNRRPK